MEVVASVPNATPIAFGTKVPAGRELSGDSVRGAGPALDRRVGLDERWIGVERVDPTVPAEL